MKTYIVEMSSPEFGLEEFPRPTLKEAKETVARLKKRIQRRNDGIKRKIEIKVITV